MDFLLGILIMISLLLLLMGLGLLARWIFFRMKKGISFIKSIEEISITFKKTNDN